MLNGIPSDVIEFTAQILNRLQGDITYSLNSNLVLTLADHISFALERAKKGIYLHMPMIYDLEQNYPMEVKAARRFLQAAERRYHVKLPKNEVVGVAMNLINARNEEGSDRIKRTKESQEEILENVTKIVEKELDIHISRDTFNYTRFATHVQYLLTRLREHKQVRSCNLQMYDTVRDECGDVSDCVDKLGEYFEKMYQTELTEEEKLYLIIHINRVCTKEGL
jgi:beta-glucoside operon transcriptional antiterminator